MTKQLKRIMCIDDEGDILAIASMALESVGGFEVTTCNGGKEALERVGEVQPDLILLDVMMPGLDGPSTYGKLKSQPNAQHIPVIFMTAKVQPKEVAQYIGMGAVGVILKPFDPMKLPKEVESLWATTQTKAG